VISNFKEIEVFHIGDQSLITNEELSILNTLNDDGKLLWNAPSNSVLEIFSHSDLHILSSLHEGMGLVIAESVVLGIETWIRDVPGVQWARGLPGVRFFETQSDLRFMISEKLKTNFAESRIINIRSEEAERFSPSRGVQQYTSLYNSLIANKV
jgi:glycosyltransferase involved in cell wall biosynthesis